MNGCFPSGGGLHIMLKALVCAAHMDGILGPEFSRKGSIMADIP